MRTWMDVAFVGIILVGGARAQLQRWMGVSIARPLCGSKSLILKGGDCPWAGKTATNSHPQKDMPDTGRQYLTDILMSRHN